MARMAQRYLTRSSYETDSQRLLHPSRREEPRSCDELRSPSFAFLIAVRCCDELAVEL